MPVSVGKQELLNAKLGWEVGEKQYIWIHGVTRIANEVENVIDQTEETS